MSGARSAAARGLAGCHRCLELASAEAERCPRCGGALHPRRPGSLERTAALLLAAALLYLPANLLPIMVTERFGRAAGSTILGGVVTLIEHGSAPVALVIFVASILVPLAKLVALAWLCICVRVRRPGDPAPRTTLYRLARLTGRWSMVDVFAVAVLAALVRFAGVLEIRPGPAVLPFAGVVVLTMLAAESFDPRLLWDAAGGGAGDA